MQVQVDPNELRYTASLFSSGAHELREKAKRIEDILDGLVQGQGKWSGEAAQAFTIKMEKLHSELQQKAGILDGAVQILNQFALQMDHVNQLRNQANQLEHTLWSITGDSEAAFHERQSISFQINQLKQEADWQANAADAQATSAFHTLSIPMPDFQNGISHRGGLEDELAGLPEAEKSYYRRHKDLIVDSDEYDLESESQPLDRDNMTAALVQYLKSKEPDYLPDDIREKAAMQDFHMLYGDLSDDELAATIQNIFDSEKQAQHFQQEIQSGNYDQNALMHESGYTQYAMNQAYQQDLFGGMHSILLGMGLVRGFDGGNGKTPEDINDKKVDSQYQSSHVVNEGVEHTEKANEEKEEILQVSSKSEALASVNELPESIQSSAKSFFKGSSTKYSSYNITRENNGNYVVSMVKPGDVPGSRAIYYKIISPAGETLRVYKDTFDPQGNLVHSKTKN